MLDKELRYHWKKINNALNNYNYEFFIGLIPEYMQIEGLSNGDQVVIDPRGQVLPTLIHECLHIAYPNWDEKKVSQIEKKLTDNLSAKQWMSLLIKFSNKI